MAQNGTVSDMKTVNTGGSSKTSETSLVPIRGKECSYLHMPIN